MRKLLRLRPSPAMVVATIALILAIGGTALASGVLTKKKVNKLITKRAPGLTVGNANALGGTKAGAFAPISYASVNSDGTVNAADSKGITSANVTKAGGNGVYCFHGFSAVPHNIEATANNGVLQYAKVVTNPGLFAGICNSVPGTRFAVTTVAGGGASFTNSDFFVLTIP